MGLSPGPFENRFHYFVGMKPAFLFIVEHIKNEYNFLWASNNALDTFVNITFVTLSLSLFILKSDIAWCSAFFKPCSYNFLTYPSENSYIGSIKHSFAIIKYKIVPLRATGTYKFLALFIYYSTIEFLYKSFSTYFDLTLDY